MIERYEGDEQELTEILKGTPLLRKFLDPDTFPDINDYLEDLDETSNIYLDQLSMRILDLDRAVINPLVFNSIAWGLGISTSEEDRVSFARAKSLTKTLLAVGFELPSTDYIDKFSYFIIYALIFRDQLFSTTRDGVSECIQRLAVQGPIYAGTYLRDHYLPDLKNPNVSSPSPSPTSTDPNVYGDFFEQLFSSK